MCQRRADAVQSRKCPAGGFAFRRADGSGSATSELETSRLHENPGEGHVADARVEAGVGRSFPGK